MPSPTKSKLRRARAKAHAEGRELGRLEGKIDAYARLALAGLGLLRRLIDMGERVETARTQAVYSKSPFGPLPADAAYPPCGSRPFSTPIDHVCDRARHHGGKHRASRTCSGLGPIEWDSCDTKDPHRAMFSTGVCGEAKGHLGDHRDETGHTWSA